MKSKTLAMKRRLHIYSIFRFWKLWQCVVLLTFLAGCGTPITVTVPSITPVQTPSSSPQPSLTPTQTVTITPSPTIAPTSTHTPAPRPTETPAGFYNHFNAGFSAIFPASWKIVEETSDHVSLMDQSARLYFVGVGSPEPEASTIEDVTQEFIQSAFANQDPSIKSYFQTTLAEGVEAQGADIEVVIHGDLLVWQILYVHANQRGYMFLINALPDDLERYRQTVDKVYTSIRIFPPEPYGLPHDQNLVLLGSDPISEDLDPAISISGPSGYAGLLFSGLVRLTPYLQIEPDLADSWTISPDGTVYTFTLKADLKFADGRSLTAQDVKDSWERTSDPDTNSSTAATYLGDILGVNEKLAGKADSIAGVKILDPQSLVVTLDGPKPYFLAKLAFLTAYVTDPSQVRGRDWMWKPNSSGPYKIKEYKEGEAIIFERNENYHTPPAIPYVTFLFYLGGSPISRYEDGTLDILFLDPETATRVRRTDDPLHGEWLSTTTLCTTFVQMNNTEPPFDDLNVRKAFAMSVDNATLVERLSNNMDVISHAILPPGMPGFSQDLSAYRFNPSGAMAALQASKYAGNLPAITISTAGFGDTDRDDVKALVDMWRTNLGVDVQVQYLEPNRYTAAARQQHGQMVLYGWCADYPDPQNFLDVLYYSESNFNVAGYTNSQVDSLLEKANIELDPPSRLKMYQQAESLLLQDVAAIPILNSVNDVLIKPRVKGFVLSPIYAAYIPWLSLKPATP